MRSSLAAFVALALAGSAHADPFQGTVVFHVMDDGISMDFRFSELGNRLRQEVSPPSGAVLLVLLYDGDAGKMTALVPKQKKYVTGKLPGGPANAQNPGGGHDDHHALDSATVTATGAHDKVAGIGCDVYVIKTGNESVEVCSAKGMGTFGANAMSLMSSASQMAAKSATSSGLSRLAKENAFPLRMKVHGADGKVMTWEATSVDRNRPDAALFTIPSDYSVSESGSIVQ